jgi:hypothetical protein
MTQLDMPVPAGLALHADPTVAPVQVSVLSSNYPATVLRLAGEEYPGIVLDGNSLFVLESASRALRGCLAENRYSGSAALASGYSATAAGLADGIAHMLSKLFVHYTETLALYGIPGPAQSLPSVPRP